MKYSLVIAALLGAMSLNDVQAVELESHHHHHNKKHQRSHMMAQEEPESISRNDQSMDEQEKHEKEINAAVKDSKAFSKK